jgi:phospholipase/lecithinase/hemolysin
MTRLDRMISLIAAAFCLLISFTAYAVPSAPPGGFSKVVFFGDSLTDIGNNKQVCYRDPANPDPQDTVPCSNQAPETNKIPSSQGDGYTDGNTWAPLFIKNLQEDGFLNNQDDLQPSVDKDNGIEIRTNVDYAYSGDPSKGYFYPQSKYHSLHEKVDGCVYASEDHENTGGSNDLCGVQNRVQNYVTNNQVDPEALYVIWVGANDIQIKIGGQLLNDILDANKDINAIQNDILSNATKAGATAISSIRTSISILQAHGAKYFMVINLPNLGDTPEGSMLNILYSFLRQEKQLTTKVTQLFDYLTNDPSAGFNPNLKKELDKDAAAYGITIFQPDINQLFSMALNGDIVAFPKQIISLSELTKLPLGGKVNLNATLSWYVGIPHTDSTEPLLKQGSLGCCPEKDVQNNVISRPNYNPDECYQEDNENHQYCSGALPNFPKNGGHYLFFNEIHQTTCVHKYLARFFESYLVSEDPVAYFTQHYAIQDLCEN